MSVELTKDQIENGARLIEALDAEGLSPRAALWMHEEGRLRWTLVLAEDDLESRGVMTVLGDVQRVLASLGDGVDLELHDITLVRPETSLIRSLVRAETRGPSLAGARLMGDWIEDRIFENAYVYRVRKPAA